jgi:hypothetical protein
VSHPFAGALPGMQGLQVADVHSVHGPAHHCRLAVLAWIPRCIPYLLSMHREVGQEQTGHFNAVKASCKRGSAWHRARR